MAEDEDSVSNKKSGQNSNNGGSSQDREQNRTDLPYFPRLLTPEAEEAKCNNSENGDASPAEAKSSSSKSTGATRKEENPFSFRHFLKRDLSLPGSSTYEHTGARPKVYARTVQPSPTREPRADHTSSSSSAEASCSVGEDSESKHNLYADGSDAQLYRGAPEPPGMPSLPDFVQDHILVEQAYLHCNGPVAVDLDNLPDFTFNTNYSAGSSPGRAAPLDLPPGAEDRHLSLDLTESVNLADRRNASGRDTFPLDLPPNAGAESMRLPDFLPAHPGRSSPAPAPASASAPAPAPARAREDAAQRLQRELERTRRALAAERGRREQLERELAAARLRHEHAQPRPESGDLESRESPESDSTVGQLRAQIRSLKEQLGAARAECSTLRARARGAAADLRGAAAGADGSLRDLLAGLEQLRGLGAALDAA